MKSRLIALMIVLLAGLPAALVNANPLAEPVLCIPSANIMYADFDQVIAQVYVPDDCPIAGDGAMNPSEVLESANVQLQRKSVASGGDFNSAPLTLVDSAVVDVTTFTPVAGNLLRANVVFSIVPSHTTTDYHRVIFEVSGTQGASAFAERAASTWLSMPPPPLEIGGFVPLPTPVRPGTLGALTVESAPDTRNNR